MLKHPVKYDAVTYFADQNMRTYHWMPQNESE